MHLRSSCGSLIMPRTSDTRLVIGDGPRAEAGVGFFTKCKCQRNHLSQLCFLPLGAFPYMCGSKDLVKDVS
ncbi:hypothetical protein AV530_000725 [Patagioenas fasciata monilis]|uniref:Uncharacterized protein n=1 Tax=Patagioenas fasciata monilis TaxID=372326 RepID=A0A1V4J782_PATFA|nr:hypothetical protein AV530_000725 [Patagioenas fasciata monilis]